MLSYPMGVPDGFLGSSELDRIPSVYVASGIRGSCWISKVLLDRLGSEG